MKIKCTIERNVEKNGFDSRAVVAINNLINLILAFHAR